MADRVGWWILHTSNARDRGRKRSAQQPGHFVLLAADRDPRPIARWKGMHLLQKAGGGARSRRATLSVRTSQSSSSAHMTQGRTSLFQPATLAGTLALIAPLRYPPASLKAPKVTCPCDTLPVLPC